MRYFILLIAYLFVFCGKEDMESDATKFFKGNHQLSTITISPDSSKRYSAATNDFYIQVNNKENNVKFMFQNTNGEYMNALIPYDKIRFIFLAEDSNTQPYCKFRWNPNSLFTESRWDNDVIYCVIAIKKSQIAP